MSDVLPTRYAHVKRSLMAQRWNGVPGRFTREYWNTIWTERIPAVCGIGFTANSTGQYERTTAAEIGYWNTPETTWNRIRTRPPVTTVLHREGVPASEFREAVADQTAIGLTDYFNGGVEVERRLNASVPRHSVLWVWLAISAYVVGPLGPVRLMQASGAHTVNDLIVWTLSHGTRQQAHFSIRTWQRLLCAKQLAEEFQPETLPWFDALPRSDLEAPLVRLSNEGTQTNVAQSNSTITTRSKVWVGVGVASAVALAVGLGYAIYESGNHGKKSKKKRQK